MHISSNIYLVLSEDLFKTGDSHTETWLQQAVLLVVSCCSAYHKVPSRKDAGQTIFQVAADTPTYGQFVRRQRVAPDVLAWLLPPP